MMKQITTVPHTHTFPIQKKFSAQKADAIKAIWLRKEKVLLEILLSDAMKQIVSEERISQLTLLLMLPLNLLNFPLIALIQI